MKILFIQLSDSHFKQDTDFREININAIVNSLLQMGKFDECILIFSGDIVSSGEINEYKVAGKFLGRLLKGINDKYFHGQKKIKTLIVPGNHDNKTKNPKRNHDDLKNYYISREQDKYYYEDLMELDNFFDFANRNGCFNKSKGIEVKTIKCKW